MKKKQFFCTRPSLAALLQQHGMKAEQTISPWNPKRNAWLFDLTPELVSLATQYYNDIDKPLPYALRTKDEAVYER